jgi:hypothetical protein
LTERAKFFAILAAKQSSKLSPFLVAGRIGGSRKINRLAMKRNGKFAQYKDRRVA